MDDMHPGSLMLLIELVTVYSKQGRYRETVELNEVLLTRDGPSHRGEDDPDILSTMSNLNIDYFHLGKLSEASVLQMKVLGEDEVDL